MRNKLDTHTEQIYSCIRKTQHFWKQNRCITVLLLLAEPILKNFNVVNVKCIILVAKLNKMLVRDKIFVLITESRNSNNFIFPKTKSVEYFLFSVYIFFFGSGYLHLHVSQYTPYPSLINHYTFFLKEVHSFCFSKMCFQNYIYLFQKYIFGTMIYNFRDILLKQVYIFQ